MSDFSFSFDDVRTLEPFCKLTEIDLLHPSSDRLVCPYLHLFGCDLDYPIEITATLHRTVYGKKHLGYRWNGSLRHDNEWINSKLCTMMDRLSVLSFYDASFVMELMQLSGSRVSYSTFSGVEQTSKKFKLNVDQLSDDWKQVEAEIEQLNRIVKQVRGESVDKNSN